MASSLAYAHLSVAQRLELKTLGDLKAAGYVPISVKEELRNNLIKTLEKGESAFKGIYGYEHTVIPQLERAILSRHNINLLGLRGQAKTRLARLMVNLLDEYVPIVAGSELNDDPLAPLSLFARTQIETLGEQTPIAWLHRQERYTEKLATPDVTVADLIGDIDPIKAANLRISYSDERSINFGLIPRTHRGIFVINEIPDLQARIQVALFNILQEGDIQIRGFKIRLPLDIQFVFTANPEDYTNRGSIVTPLKDRIGSQIITHYPPTIEISKKITQQEAQIKAEQRSRVQTFEFSDNLLEAIAFTARESELVDAKSGISARLTISAYENLISTAERRAILNKETQTYLRISDFMGIVPALAGKIELVYEGEQEGAGIVAQSLINKSLRNIFTQYFPNPEKEKKNKINLYKNLLDWFEAGNTLELRNDLSTPDYEAKLESVPFLKKIVLAKMPHLKGPELYLMMEFCLHGLAEYSAISRKNLDDALRFSDLLSSMFSLRQDEDEEDEDY
jgi:magnesium chelatase subunit I